MATYDLVITNGTVVDGTGLPRRKADVGVKDGRIAAIGFIDAWRLAGSFDNDQGKGFLTAYPPEAGVDVAATRTRT